MKPSIEFLFHCHCDHCQLWWTIADRINFERLHCPHCGKANTVELPLNHGIGGSAAFPVAYQLKLGQAIEQLIAELKGGSSNQQVALNGAAIARFDVMAKQCGVTRSELIERAAQWLDYHWDTQLRRDLGSDESTPSPLEPIPKPTINTMVESIGQNSEWYSRGLSREGDRTNDGSVQD